MPTAMLLYLLLLTWSLQTTVCTTESRRRATLATIPDLSGLPPEIQADIRQSYYGSVGKLDSPSPATTHAPTTQPAGRQPPMRCRGQVRHWDQRKCSAGRSKWTYNTAAGRCQWFAHFGCQLNSGNVFSSRRDCETACVRGVEDPCSVARCVPISPFYKSNCFLASDSICIGGIMRRYASIRDASIRSVVAQPDIEVNCQAPVARCLNSGINIRLPTMETPPVLESPSLPAHCRLPPDRGYCPPGSRGRLSRVYFYSWRRNECKFMVHFGCRGNSNKFASQAQCHNMCAL